MKTSRGQKAAIIKTGHSSPNSKQAALLREFCSGAP